MSKCPEVKIKEIHATERDGLRILAEHPMFRQMVIEMGDFFRAQKGVSFVTMTMTHPELGNMELTVQRCAGKTPAELRTEDLAREAKLRALATRLAVVLNDCANGIQQCPDAFAAIDAVLHDARAAGLLDSNQEPPRAP